MSEEINVDVTTTEASDGNVHSFDDLDSMTSNQSDVEVVKEAVKEVKESNDKVMETIKEESQPKQEAKAEDQSKQQELVDDVEAELVEEIKKLHAKFNDEEIEIPEQAVLTVKIDGEEVEVPISELRNNYSGKTAWEKKFNELSSEKKDFSKDKEAVEKYVMEFGELARRGDKIGAMQYLAQLSGMDPLSFRKDLRDQVLEEYKSVLNMDENQRKAFELEEENKFLRESKESDHQRLQKEQEYLQAQQQVVEIQEALGIDESKWDSASQDLLEEGYTADQITPETIGQYLYATKVYADATSALGSVSEELAANDEAVEVMFDIINQNPDFSQEDLSELIIETWGNPTKPKSASKKAIASSKKSAPVETNSSHRSKIDEFYSFEQFEE